MTRQSLEKYQVLIYLASISAGLIIGFISPETGAALETALWYVLGALIYATMTQIPLTHLRDAFADARFLAAAVIGNFIILPLAVWGLILLAPDNSVVRLGIAMVLLVPCTDWFITFTHLGGGDTKSAIAFAPLSLLLQMLLLPLYLWVLLGGEMAITLATGDMLKAFLGLIVLPLLAALATERWVESGSNRAFLIERLGWLPVPLLAIVVFIIAASQVYLVAGSVAWLSPLLLIFGAFLIVASAIARSMAALFRLPARQGRALAFSFGTRNSFVVLPLALALPPGFEVAVVVIVFQSLVELFGMAIYLWWVPQRLFP
ncbi:MAG: arsenic resistance protein [Roseiflexus sp.]|nr:arsenic resistance protein [Roseiflexus sp.]MCS7288547.1 arsenic resistance protein [Roseiflexus sp.]MDW8148239.1 arsenic resistance protein [Roseiflexaceae bacterium]MDW8233543.1 arsenic resistance protein [Roseiflexaceae bacterium]